MTVIYFINNYVIFDIKCPYLFWVVGSYQILPLSFILILEMLILRPLSVCARV